MKSSTRLLVTIFLGWAGIHRFLDRKFVTGVLYLLTFGLFGIGWIVDIFVEINHAAKDKRIRHIEQPEPVSAPPKTISNRPQPTKCTSPVVEKTFAPKPSVPVENSVPLKHDDFSEKYITNPKASSTYVISANYIRQCKTKFIAFDLETTGLSCYSDKIIEISAVIFENFQPKDTFSTLINPGIHIPASASRINGIYDDDVKDAPSEQQAIHSFCDFVGNDALNGDVVLVAHNAKFDLDFLLRALSRSGIDADLYFQDTLYLARHYKAGSTDNKLSTLAAYYGIQNENAHRAANDAEVCGKIFCIFLGEKEKQQKEAFSSLSEKDQSFCLWVRDALTAAGCDISPLVFNSLSSSHLSVSCLYTIFKAKPKAKQSYVLVDKTLSLPPDAATAPAVKSEGENLVRVFYNDLHDIEFLIPYIVKEYKKYYEKAVSFCDQSQRNAQELAKAVELGISI